MYVNDTVCHVRNIFSLENLLTALSYQKKKKKTHTLYQTKHHRLEKSNHQSSAIDSGLLHLGVSAFWCLCGMRLCSAFYYPRKPFQPFQQEMKHSNGSIAKWRSHLQPGACGIPEHVFYIKGGSVRHRCMLTWHVRKMGFQVTLEEKQWEHCWGGEKKGILLFWFDDQLMLINICTFITTPNMEADFSFLFNLGFFLKPEQEEWLRLTCIRVTGCCSTASVCFHSHCTVDCFPRWPD